jgi:hypothetical protein
MRAARQVHSTVLLGTLAPALDLWHLTYARSPLTIAVAALDSIHPPLIFWLNFIPCR